MGIRLPSPLLHQVPRYEVHRSLRQCQPSRHKGCPHFTAAGFGQPRQPGRNDRGDERRGLSSEGTAGSPYRCGSHPAPAIGGQLARGQARLPAEVSRAQPIAAIVACEPPQPNFPARYQRLRPPSGRLLHVVSCRKAVPNTPQRFQRLTICPDSSVQHGCDTGSDDVRGAFAFGAHANCLARLQFGAYRSTDHDHLNRRFRQAELTLRYTLTVVEQLDRAASELAVDHPINNRLALILVD